MCYGVAVLLFPQSIAQRLRSTEALILLGSVLNLQALGISAKYCNVWVHAL